MKLSTKGRYGLKAVLDIAEYCEGEAVSIKSVSKRQGISEKYLEQLISKLKKAGILKSVRGANGGYMLSRPAGEISVGDVIRATEGNLKACECSDCDPSDSCGIGDLCVTKTVWDRINTAIEDAVDTIYLSELVNKSRELKEAKKADGRGEQQ